MLSKSEPFRSYDRANGPPNNRPYRGNKDKGLKKKEDIYNIVSGVGSEANFYELESIRPTDDGTLKVNCEDNMAIVELNGKVTKIETPNYDNWVERQARDAEGNTYYFREGEFIIQSPDGSKKSYNYCSDRT